MVHYETKLLVPWIKYCGYPDNYSLASGYIYLTFRDCHFSHL